MKINGRICPGYGIASQGSVKTQELVSNIYPGEKIIVDQTVYRQFPHFISAGVAGIEKMHPGTINIDISPNRFTSIKPEHIITCEWIPGIEETFLLTPAPLFFKGVEYDGYIYVPFISSQDSTRKSMVEIITEKIPGIVYGEAVSISFDSERVSILN